MKVKPYAKHVFDKKGSGAINYNWCGMSCQCCTYGTCTFGPCIQCTTEQCDCNDEDLTANQTDYVYHTASVQVRYECTYRF